MATNSAITFIKNIENLATQIKDYVSGKLYFSGLHDTPTGYLSGYYVRANETGIEYIHPTGVAKELSEHLGAGNGSFTGLQDTPSDYLSGYYIRSTEKGLEYIDPTGLAKTIPSIPQGYLTLEEIPSMPSKHDGELIKVGCDLYLSCEGQWKKVSSDEDSNLLDPSLVPLYPDCVYTNADAIAYNNYKAQVEADQLGDLTSLILDGDTRISDTTSNVCLSANVDGNIVKPNIVSSVSTACDSPFQNNTLDTLDSHANINDIDGLGEIFLNNYSTIPSNDDVWRIKISTRNYYANHRSGIGLFATHGDYMFVSNPAPFFNKDSTYFTAKYHGFSDSSIDDFVVYQQGDKTYDAADLPLTYQIFEGATGSSLDTKLETAGKSFGANRWTNDQVKEVKNCHYGKLLLYKRNGTSWELVNDLTLNGNSAQYIFDDKSGYQSPYLTELGINSEDPNISDNIGYSITSSFGRQGIAWDGKTLVVGSYLHRRVRQSDQSTYLHEPVLFIYNTSSDGKIVNLEAVRFSEGDTVIPGEMFTDIYGGNVQRSVARNDFHTGYTNSNYFTAAYDSFAMDVQDDTICQIIGNGKDDYEILKKNSGGQWYQSEMTKLPGSANGVTFLGSSDKIAFTYALNSDWYTQLSGASSILIMVNKAQSNYEPFANLFHLNVEGQYTEDKDISYSDGMLVVSRERKSTTAWATSLMENAHIVLDISELIKMIDEDNISGSQLADLATQEAREKFEVWASRWKPWFKNLKIVDPETGTPTGETINPEEIDEVFSWDTVTGNFENWVTSLAWKPIPEGIAGYPITASFWNQIDAHKDHRSFPHIILNYVEYFNMATWRDTDSNPYYLKIREFNPLLIGSSVNINSTHRIGLVFHVNVLEDIIKRPVKKRICTSAISVSDFQSLNIEDFTNNPEDYYKLLYFYGFLDKGTYLNGDDSYDPFKIANPLRGDAAYADCESDSMGYGEYPFIYRRNYDDYHGLGYTESSRQGESIDISNGQLTSLTANNWTGSNNRADSIYQEVPFALMNFTLTDCGGYSYILLSDNVKVAIDETSYRWGIFQQGETINITATVGDGCSFIGWSTTDPSILGTPTAETSTLQVPGDVSVVGLFSCN